MASSSKIFRSETGLAGYDNARWTGALPRLNYVRNAWGMSTLLQCGVETPGAEMEADVPSGDHAVTLFRIASPAKVERRVFGRPAQATYRVGEGTLLAAGTDSWWAVNHETSSGWFHVHFDHALINAVESTHNLKLETVPNVADPQITVLVNLIFEVVSRAEEPDPLLWQSLSQVLLWRLLLLTSGKRRMAETRGGLAQWQARRTTEYLADHLDQRVTLEELAGIARLSPFHFARAFSKTVGMPPFRYQQKLRLERACELLAKTDLRIIDIAQAVGYQSPRALTRVFVQQHAIAPSEWRRQFGRD
jgi:AraC-like DNA-binding protein